MPSTMAVAAMSPNRSDDRIDLAAEMLREGWAFVRPEAPPLYHSLERLARTREIGMWDDAVVNLR